MTPSTAHARRPSRLRARAEFFRQFITNPGMIGSITPSSKALTNEMLRTVEFSATSRVCEYGPGTGAFTEEILRRVKPGGRFFAIERNAGLTRELRGRLPQLRLHEGSVEDIVQYCRTEGVEQLDAIVSGIPWASLPQGLQRRILTETMKVLRPGGQFITFGYHMGLLTPAGRRFAKMLPDFFSSWRRSRPVWRNTPPAFVLRCIR